MAIINWKALNSKKPGWLLYLEDGSKGLISQSKLPRTNPKLHEQIISVITKL